jgi:hypothetical protein
MRDAMNRPMRLLTLLPLLALCGCATTYCEGEQDYQTAPSVPVVQPAGGLKVQDSSSALRIPPAPESAVPYGETYRDEDGDDAVRCLDQPPEMPPTDIKPGEGKPPPEETAKERAAPPFPM